MSQVTHINKSCHTYERVKSHVSHVTHKKHDTRESCHIKNTTCRVFYV